MIQVIMNLTFFRRGLVFEVVEVDIVIGIEVPGQGGRQAFGRDIGHFDIFVQVLVVVKMAAVAVVVVVADIVVVEKAVVIVIGRRLMFHA